MKLFSKIKERIKKIFRRNRDCRNEDEIHLSIDGLDIYLNRCFEYDIPHEVTIIIPRAELRKKIKVNDREEELEILLNSITVVHSPQRPSDGGEGSVPEPPEIPRNHVPPIP